MLWIIISVVLSDERSASEMLPLEFCLPDCYFTTDHKLHFQSESQSVNEQVKGSKEQIED